MTATPLSGSVPDPLRTGGPGWLAATGGRLTWGQRVTMFGQSMATQGQLVSQQVRRRRAVSTDLASVARLPDSRLVREAEEAALCQSPALLAHGYRTAVFARALALVDGIDVDHELLVVAALLHDAGLVPAVTGEDFTLRSAAVATGAAVRAEREDARAPLHDAICVHTTIGITPERDGALGAYTQYGAMVDLVGLRERHLPHDLIVRTLAEHPREGFVREIIPALHAEARAVRGGRFAFLRCVGFGPAVRMASLPSRP